MHRVGVATRADVVVAPQPGGRRGSDRRRHRRQLSHRRAIRGHGLRRDRAGGGVTAAVGHPGQPVTELGVEVRRRGELPARQKRGPQVAVGPFHQAFGFGVIGPGLNQPGAQHPAEPRHPVSQPATLADPGLVVPQQTPRNATDVLGEQ